MGAVDGLRGETGTMELKKKKVEALWEGVEALGGRGVNNHSRKPGLQSALEAQTRCGSSPSFHGSAIQLGHGIVHFQLEYRCLDTYWYLHGVKNLRSFTQRPD